MAAICDIAIDGAFARACEFLTALGFAVREEPQVSGFLEGVAIRNGDLVVRAAEDEIAGELLHEAGHLAVLPTRFRHLASGDLSQVNELMHDWMMREGHLVHPDDPQIRSILQCGECEASAWSYAAALAIGIDTRVPFYRGYEGDGLIVHDQIASGRYFGVHGLAAGGMTELPKPWSAQPFPAMKRWLQI
jgi:hypothetical protein